MDSETIKKIENDNREQKLKLVDKVQNSIQAKGWTEPALFVVGGLTEVGFSESGEYLLLVSSSGRGLIDCTKLEKIARDYDDGDSLELIAPEWPKYQVIFQPGFNSFYSSPELCERIFNDYTVHAYGFSYSGKTMVIATSGEVYIYRTD